MEHFPAISEQNGKSVVSARELWYALEVKTDFSEWCKRMFDYGLVIDIDFSPILGKSTGGRPSIDYALTIDCAKSIAMLQRSPIGKKVRDYFIDCERKLLQLAKPSGDEMILMAITELQNRVDNVKAQLSKANETIIEQAPKVKYVNEVLDGSNLISTTIIAKDLGMSAKELNKALSRRNVIYNQGGTWVLYAKYQALGYTHSKTHTYYDSEGKTRNAIHTFWTEKGRKFIHELMDKALYPTR